MSIRNTVFAAVFALAASAAAHAEGLRPIEAKSIDLGGVSGIAYYTVEPDGFHVVTTLRRARPERRSASCRFLPPVRASFSRRRNGADRSKSAGTATSVLVRKATVVSN